LQGKLRQGNARLAALAANRIERIGGFRCGGFMSKQEQTGGKTMQQPSELPNSNSAAAGKGEVKTNSSTPENAAGKLNPSSPGETGTTPKTNWDK
jgi:hypothetical protein